MEKSNEQQSNGLHLSDGGRCVYYSQMQGRTAVLGLDTP
jgi:hypothetical protein